MIGNDFRYAMIIPRREGLLAWAETAPDQKSKMEDSF